MGAADEDLMEWLTAAREGDERALSRLLEHIRPRIEGFLRQRVDSNPAPDALAEELTQDTLLKVTTSIEECRAETAAQLRAWTRTIARRASVDWYRKREPELDRRAWTDLTAVPPTLLGAALLDADEDPDAGRHSDADRTLGRILLDAQAELSAGTQQVIRERLLYGASWEAAGRAVGTTTGGAKRRWQRARERLRREVVTRARDLPVDLRREVLRKLGHHPV